MKWSSFIEAMVDSSEAKEKYKIEMMALELNCSEWNKETVSNETHWNQ